MPTHISTPTHPHTFTLLMHSHIHTHSDTHLLSHICIHTHRFWSQDRLWAAEWPSLSILHLRKSTPPTNGDMSPNTIVTESLWDLSDIFPGPTPVWLSSIPEIKDIKRHMGDDGKVGSLVWGMLSWLWAGTRNQRGVLGINKIYGN